MIFYPNHLLYMRFESAAHLLIFCCCFYRMALVLSSSDFFFLAALAIWYLMRGSPVCKLSLVQSSAEKEEKKNSLL